MLGWISLIFLAIVIREILHLTMYHSFNLLLLRERNLRMV